jgi:hypothetical protein
MQLHALTSGPKEVIASAGVSRASNPLQKTVQTVQTVQKLREPSILQEDSFGQFERSTVQNRPSLSKTRLRPPAGGPPPRPQARSWPALRRQGPRSAVWTRTTGARSSCRRAYPPTSCMRSRHAAGASSQAAGPTSKPCMTAGSPACRSRNSRHEHAAPVDRAAHATHPCFRASDDGCSAKNTTVAALTTTTPMKGCHHGSDDCDAHRRRCKGGCDTLSDVR